MPAFRIKRQLLATGGATISGCTTISGSLSQSTLGALTAGSLTISSGSTTVSASGIAIGGGTKFTKLLYGSGVVNAPSFDATGAASGGAPGSCQMALTGALATDYIFTTATSAPAGLVLTSVTGGTNLINLDFQAAACTAVAGCALTIQYLLLRA